MKIMYHMAAAAVVVTALLLAGCEQPFDQRELPSDIPASADTSYVRLDPPFYGFVGAEDLLIGNDQLLYVADTRANRVVMLNRAGQVMSQRSMLHPRAITQDSRLDLLVGGELVAANGDTVGATFRIHLVASADSAHRLDVARIDTLWRELAKPVRRFPGITILPDNSYLVVRTGPDNASFVDPDARVLLFNKNDKFVTPVPGLVTGVGNSITSINRPTAIASFPGLRDFIVVQTSEGVQYEAVWLGYLSTSEFEGWMPKFDPANQEQRGVDFIRPNRFLNPQAVTIDKARRDVFIADAGLDSVFKFNSRGAFKSESFGAARSGGMLVNPTGLAFFERVLYVLDGTRGTIERFRLSTDVPR